MLYSKPELVKLAVEIATQSNLDPALVCAHIDVRSQWNSGLAVPTAIYHLTHAQFPDPMESEYRSIQWGLMGIGGEFARSLGYSASLPDLLLPSTNLREGCRLLSDKIRQDSLGLYPDLENISRHAVSALLSWNSENSQEKAFATLSKLEAYRELLLRIPESPPPFDRHPQELSEKLLIQIEGNELLPVSRVPFSTGD